MTTGPTQRSRRRRRRWIAPVAASLAAHVLLLAALSRGIAPLPRSPPARIAVELVPLPAPPRLAVPHPPRLSSPAAPPLAERRDRRRAPSAEAAAPPTRPGALPASPPALADEGIAAPPPERTAPDLRPRLSIVAPPSAVARGDAAAPTPPRDALRSWAADLAARARAEGGLSHPYHSALASALARSWDVEDTIKARGVSGYLAHAGENLAAFGRVWSRDAEAFGRTGATSVVDGASERFRELAGLPPGPARDALAQAEIGRQLRRAFSEGHVASVRVVQDRAGRLESVELVSPSIDAALDREALAAVPAAVAKVPVPREVLAGRDRLATVWEFEIEVSISPPIPLVAIEFDEALGHLDLRVPLDRRIWKRVRLVAIE